MKALELSFKGSDLRIKHLRLKYVNTDLTADDVQKLMNEIAAAKLFNKDGVDLYATPVRADIIETTKTNLLGDAVTPAV